MNKKNYNTACCNCKEGYVIGKNVYCNYDGRFHPLHDDSVCKKFIPKNNLGTTCKQDEDEIKELPFSSEAHGKEVF